MSLQHSKKEQQRVNVAQRVFLILGFASSFHRLHPLRVI